MTGRKQSEGGVLPAEERFCGMNAAMVIELGLVMQDEFVTTLGAECLAQVALKPETQAGVGVEFG